MKLQAPFDNQPTENHAPRIIAVGLLAALLLTALTGCKGEPQPAAADLDPVGIYPLVSVNGKALPCKLNHEGVNLTVKAGTFTINRSGTCRSVCAYSAPPHPDMIREVKAAYTLKGATLTLRWSGAGTTQGQINGDTFTMTNEGAIFSDRK